jgi:hypothetical protein
MQFITRHSREHVRRVGRAISLTDQALSRSTRTVPAPIRRLSSTASPTTTAGGLSSSPSPLAIALGTALVGLGSYYVGSLNDGGGGSASTKATTAATPVYGTPEDFKRAIKELEASFEEDVVSTDPPNLFTHGFSPNVMHEGECQVAHV